MVKKQTKKKKAAAAVPAKSAAKKKTAGGSRKKVKVAPVADTALTLKNVRENVRCRVCRVVDGYRAKESNCRFCGAKLFKEDVV